MKSHITVVDLYSGCGGNMIGCDKAIREFRLTYSGHAIDYWGVALSSLHANFPDVAVHKRDITDTLMHDIGFTGEADLVWASPSCTHHSRARGGLPRSEESRAQPDTVIPWLRDAKAKCLIVENVPEFMDWGPLRPDGTPDPTRKGELFNAWVCRILELGYNVEYRVLNCADYGDATSRHRFFLMATRRPLRPPVFPDPTHGDGRPNPVRTIRDCLDTSLHGRSIFNRASPIAETTLLKIALGAWRYWGVRMREDGSGIEFAAENPDPFIVKMRKGARVDPVDVPISTITCGGRHHALCQLVDCGARKDITLRMLQPDEYARAHSFPDTFKLVGDATERTRQIGNSVPANTAYALCKAVLTSSGFLDDGTAE